MLPRDTIDTTVLPPGERFGMWLDLVARTSAPLRIRSAHSDDFAARADFIELGPIQLVQYDTRPWTPPGPRSWSASPTRSCTSSPSPPAASARPARTVASSEILAGEFTFYDASRPHDVCHHADRAGPRSRPPRSSR